MAHTRIVHENNSALTRKRSHVHHSLINRSVQVVCEQDSPGLSTASQALVCVGGTCWRFKPTLNGGKGGIRTRLRTHLQQHAGPRMASKDMKSVRNPAIGSHEGVSPFTGFEPEIRNTDSPEDSQWAVFNEQAETTCGCGPLVWDWPPTSERCSSTATLPRTCCFH